MKGILSRSLVFSLCLLLALPAVAGAAFSRTEQLSGTYVRSDQQGHVSPTNYFEFSGGSFKAVTLGDIKQGKYSISGDRIEFVHSDGKVEIFRFSSTQNTVTIGNSLGLDTYVRLSNEQIAAIERYRAEEARRKVEEARRAEEEFKRNFIARSERSLNWSDAKAFCQRQGGRLPLINGSDSWAWSDRGKITHIDGFGAPGSPWPSGLQGVYWSGTEFTDLPGRSWVLAGSGGVIAGSGGKVNVGNNGRQGEVGRVVCVPRSAEEERRAKEEEARKEEEWRRAEEAFRADQERRVRELGFIALSEDRMTWLDAVAFCQQKGGRLPLINGSTSLTSLARGAILSGGATIDGFGTIDSPWPSGLPGASFWSGTELTDGPGNSWFVNGHSGSVSVSYNPHSSQTRVVCVPPMTEEATRRAVAEEEGHKAAEEPPKVTFTVMSQIPLSWPDAIAFCRQQGGGLPRINNSDSWAWTNKNQITLVDGFGANGVPWPAGLPGGSFWAGTQISDHSGYSWLIGDADGKANIGGTAQGEAHRVVCVGPTAPAPVSKSAPVASPPAYPPLTADGKPKAAAHLVRLENGVVELALQVLAPGKSIEAIRIDNLGGVSSRWRSDGKEEGAPLSVSQGGNTLSSGAQAMNLALGDAEALLSLSLKDNGAFAGKATEFRVTAFFSSGERAMSTLNTQ